MNNSVAANQETTKTVFFVFSLTEYSYCLSFCYYFVLRYSTKGSPYSITERRVPELILVLGSQPAGDVSHKPGRKPPLISASPAVTLTTLKRVVANFAAW